MKTLPLPQVQFVTLAIGATAQRMGITATELHNRLKQHGLVRRLLLDCYEDKPADSPGADYVKYNLDRDFIQEETDFIERALRLPSWTTAKHHFVLSHGAPYSQYDACEMMPFILQRMTDPFFEGENPPCKLDAWLAGHSHRYGRSIPGTNKIAAWIPPHAPQKGGTTYRFPVLTVAGPDSKEPIPASAFRVDVGAEYVTVTAVGPDGLVFEKVRYYQDGTCEEVKKLTHYEAIPLENPPQNLPDFLRS